MFYVKQHLKYKQIKWASENNLECIGLNVPSIRPSAAVGGINAVKN